MATEPVELDDLAEDDPALQLPDHCLAQVFADGRAWSEDDDEGTVPDDLDDDGDGIPDRLDDNGGA